MRGQPAGRVRTGGPGPGALGIAPPVATVAVVGGGPAGLEAARSLASAGYAVELFEGAQRLGGQFRMACRIPGKEDFARTIEYFEHELAALGVSVSLGARWPTRVHGCVRRGRGRNRRPAPGTGLPGVELPHVRSYASLLLDDGDGARMRRRVAIIGAGGIGVDVAHLLSAAGDETDRIAAFYARTACEPPTGAIAPGTSPGGPTLRPRGRQHHACNER